MSSRAPNPSASAEREGKAEGGAPSSEPPPAAAPPPGAPPPPPPEEPAPGDCCGSGCVRCVWDIYYDELEAYDRLMAERETTQTKKKKNPDRN